MMGGMDEGGKKKEGVQGWVSKRETPTKKSPS